MKRFLSFILAICMTAVILPCANAEDFDGYTVYVGETPLAISHPRRCIGAAEVCCSPADSFVFICFFSWIFS